MNRLQHRRSASANLVPTLAQMLEAEIAINTTDKNVYFSTGTEVVHLNHLKNAKSDALNRTVTDAQIAAWSSSQQALGYTPANRAGDTLTGPLYLFNAPTVGNGAATKAYVDQSVALISGTYRAPVQTLAGLAAVSPSGLPDKALCLVEDAGSLYHFDAQSEIQANGTTIIAPTAGGTGRWLKMQAATSSHEGLAGLLGGADNDHQHLTSAELSAIVDHYADREIHLTQEQNTLLDQLVVSATDLNALDGVNSNVQDQLDSKQADLGYPALSKNGDTMTGPLILGRDPEAGPEAATKNYVDQALLDVNTYADEAVVASLVVADQAAIAAIETSTAAQKTYIDRMVVESAESSELFASQADAALVLQIGLDVEAVLVTAKDYTDTQIAGLQQNTTGASVEYVNLGLTQAVTDARAYTDQVVSALPAASGAGIQYVDESVGAALTTAAAYTDQKIAALPAPIAGVTESYVDQQAGDAVTAAASYTDQQIAAIVAPAPGITEQDVEAIADQVVSTAIAAQVVIQDSAHVQMLETAASDATNKSTAAIDAAKAYTDTSLEAFVLDYVERDTQITNAIGLGVDNKLEQAALDSKSYADLAVAAKFVPYDLHGTLYGTVSANEVLLRVVMARACVVEQGMGSSIAVARIAATSTMEFTVARNGIAFGTLTFAANQTSGVWFSTEFTAFVRGDVLEVLNVSGVEDPSLQDVSMMITAAL